MIKKFNNFLNENILDDEDDIENKWEVRIDDSTDSFWEYKSDAIDRVLEILDTEGDSSLEGYKDEDDYELNPSEITDILMDLDESEFYDKLEELKDFTGYILNIKLYNIADEDELEFLEEE